MRDTGGRRIKRSINIDLNTIRFCTEEEKKRLVEKGWIKDNTETEELTNLSAFTSYLQEYLVHHPHTHKRADDHGPAATADFRSLPLESIAYGYDSMDGI